MFTFYLGGGILLLLVLFPKGLIELIIVLFILCILIYNYVEYQFGYVIDILFKKIDETDWILKDNIKWIGGNETLGVMTGFDIKVLEDGKKARRFTIFDKLAPMSTEEASHYKIYYLRMSRAVVGWEIIEVPKKKMKLNQKPRKSK